MALTLALALLSTGAVRAQTAGASASASAVSGQTMGTTFSVKWTPRDGTPSPKIIQGRTQSTLDRIEARMSTYRADSEISRFNAHTETNWFPISLETAQVITEAWRLSQATDGAFDITIFPLVDLWGFGPRRGLSKEPSDSQIEAARKNVGYQLLAVRLDPPAVRKLAAAVQLDLSGIAKGYAADAVAIELETLGVRDYLIAVGGDLKARGNSPQAKSWRVGIDRPEAGTREIQHTIDLRDQALSTSGDYRNFHEIGTRRYSHIIDPRTGWPATNAVVSASVLHSSGAHADALATALMILGPERARALLPELKFEWQITRRENGRLVTYRSAFPTTR